MMWFQMEAKVVMAKLLQRFEFSLVPGQSFDILDTLTLRPKSGVVCNIKHRNPNMWNFISQLAGLRSCGILLTQHDQQMAMIDYLWVTWPVRKQRGEDMFFANFRRRCSGKDLAAKGNVKLSCNIKMSFSKLNIFNIILLQIKDRRFILFHYSWVFVKWLFQQLTYFLTIKRRSSKSVSRAEWNSLAPTDFPHRVQTNLLTYLGPIS